ncbi:hypothetical protein PENSPDRAFT_502619 [Peniophora sp. CONT]|nr:hypothetical protein PENSPDRAFT_502619 [Peniophora sp. CONT]
MASSGESYHAPATSEHSSAYTLNPNHGPPTLGPRNHTILPLSSPPQLGPDNENSSSGSERAPSVAVDPEAAEFTGHDVSAHPAAVFMPSSPQDQAGHHSRISRLEANTHSMSVQLTELISEVREGNKRQEEGQNRLLELLRQQGDEQRKVFEQWFKTQQPAPASAQT